MSWAGDTASLSRERVIRSLLALMLTECHKPSFKLLPAKETGKASIGMIEWGGLEQEGLILLTCCAPPASSAHSPCLPVLKPQPQHFHKLHLSSSVYHLNSIIFKVAEPHLIPLVSKQKGKHTFVCVLQPKAWPYELTSWYKFGVKGWKKEKKTSKCPWWFHLWVVGLRRL